MKIALCLGVALCLSLSVFGQTRGKPGTAPTRPNVIELSEDAGREFIEEFRQLRLAGDYIFQFTLEHHPRRGRSGPVFEGVMWGSWGENGPLTRVALWSEDKPERPQFQLLIHGGAEPEVWRIDDGDEAARKLNIIDMTSPLITELSYTPTDLAMPFIFWDSFDYVGTDRVLSRPVHLFDMYPSGEYASVMPWLEYVRLSLDTGFKALLKAEYYGRDGEEIRSFKIRSWTEIQDQYIITEIDLLDEVSRDYTEFKVEAASTGLDLPDYFFNPETLAKGVPPWRRYALERV